MRTEVKIEVELRPERIEDEHRNRYVTPWRVEVLIGGQPTGAYAKMEVSRDSYVPLEEILRAATPVAIASFIGRMKRAHGEEV